MTVETPLILRGTLVALALLSPIHGLAQGAERTPWSKTLSMALSLPHTTKTECDEVACFQMITVVGSPYMLVIVKGHQGQVMHMICVNKQCEHD